MYIEVEDVNDMAPWPERASYAAAVPEHCPAGTRVAAVRAEDGDAAPAPANITYSIVAGNPDGLFSIDEHTGNSFAIILFFFLSRAEVIDRRLLRSQAR